MSVRLFFFRPVLHFEFSLAGKATDHKVGEEVVPGFVGKLSNDWDEKHFLMVGGFKAI